MKNIYNALGLNIFTQTDDIKEKTVNMSHCHDTFELLYIIKGKGRFIIEGTEFVVCPKSIIITRPLAYHFLEIEEGEYDRVVINFTPSNMSKEVRPLFDDLIKSNSKDNGIYYPPENISSATLSVFDRFNYALALNEKEKDTYVRLLLSELVLLLTSTTRQFIVRDEMELGARIAKYINDYLDKDHSLDVLSKRFFVSKYYLCHVFKKYSGISLHSYVNLKRIHLAKQLIEAGETASGAAYLVGFGDYSAFYRAYVKIIGTTPTLDVKKKQKSEKT